MSAVQVLTNPFLEGHLKVPKDMLETLTSSHFLLVFSYRKFEACHEAYVEVRGPGTSHEGPPLMCAGAAAVRGLSRKQRVR